MKITIKRPKSKNYDESKYKIYINGQKVATLQENQLQEIEVNNSSIAIEAKVNWAGSKRLNLKVNDGDAIEFSPNTLFNKASIAILFVLTNSFETHWLKWAFGILLAVDVFLILYIMIIARRKWVSINHIKQ